jgi:hypothetical protein
VGGGHSGRPHFLATCCAAATVNRSNSRPTIGTRRHVVRCGARKMIASEMSRRRAGSCNFESAAQRHRQQDVSVHHASPCVSAASIPRGRKCSAANLAARRDAGALAFRRFHVRALTMKLTVAYHADRERARTDRVPASVLSADCAEGTVGLGFSTEADHGKPQPKGRVQAGAPE